MSYVFTLFWALNIMKKSSVLIYSLMFVLYGFFINVHARIENKDEAIKALTLVNEARSKNGLLQLKHYPVLDQITNKHNEYMIINKTCDHYERSDQLYFFGVSPSDRLKTAKYPIKQISENISCSDSGLWKHSVSGLMGAIYHRFGFLDFNVNEIGFSHNRGYKMDSTGMHKFSYLMGNSYMRKMCSSKNESNQNGIDFNRFYQNICMNEDIKIKESEYNTTKNVLLKDGPKIVVYPWNEQTNVYPAFLDNEKPDPTPTLKLSGSPISVQFNPFYFKMPVKIISFALEDETGQPISVWQLDNLTDVNNKITKFEFAWFPLAPLKWGTQYKATLEYESEEKIKIKKWTFSTEASSKNIIATIEEK